ncbi:short-chain dehydrogenase [Sphaerosporella brunnea]|uniref:Short-chain dehydrogenase n=1 Tax=Sphaerosporella brunnea TaxID=1250544 RepID=A0A5J5EPC2_9PEZI|nr:short-chain dehydrogenase [Sphaerosporella brunnea]
MSSTPRLQSLTGKLAIITGASRGIGAAIAQNLASKGCDLILNHSSAYSAGDCQSVCSDLLTVYPQLSIRVVCADVGTVTGPRELIAAAGGKQIDILINNAGTSGNQYLAQVTPEEFERQYNVNVRGPLLLVQAALPFLPHDRSGRIVNTSSVSSSMGLKAQSVYGGTKAALEAMTRTWARELAERATVNAINPGPVETRMYLGTSDEFQMQIKPLLEMTPLAQLSEAEKKGPYKDRAEFFEKHGGRWGKPEEVAGIVGMLCSAEAGYCTGQVICANGGMVMMR